MAKSIKKNKSKPKTQEVVKNVITEQNMIEETQLPQEKKLYNYKFITKLNNIRFAEDLVMNNLDTTIFETTAENINDAVCTFVHQCKLLYPINTDEQVKSVLKIMFGKSMTVIETEVGQSKKLNIDL